MGDRESEQLEELYRRRYARFVATAAAIVGPDGAHDVVQEAFARALRGDRADAAGSLEAWVWRILVNAAYDVHRRATRRATFTVGQEIAFVAAGRDEALIAAIRSLSPRRRVVVFLRYFAEMTNEEIAAVCEITSGTVAATLSQAQDALRRELEREREREEAPR